MASISKLLWSSPKVLWCKAQTFESAIVFVSKCHMYVKQTIIYMQKAWGSFAH